jgi:hypothetical protein
MIKLKKKIRRIEIKELDLKEIKLLQKKAMIKIRN